MPNASLRGWTIATSLGFCLAFLAFLPLSQLSFAFAPEAVAGIDPARLPQHLDPDDLPEWLDRPTYEALYRFNVYGHLVGFIVSGAILGSFQAYALRSVLRGVGPWVLTSSAGFTAILLAELVEPHVVTGPYMGPVEPVMIALGGGGLAGVFQWLRLRRQGVDASRWSMLWIAGLALGVVAALAILLAFELTLLESVKSLFTEETAGLVDWAIFLVIYGAGTGAAAGWLSGRALLRALGATGEPASRAG